MNKTLLFISFFYIIIVSAQNDTIIDAKFIPEIALKKSKINGDEEIHASFSLGTDEFRKMLANNFNMNLFQKVADIHCDLSFIVEIDGTLSGIKAIGENQNFNDEAILAVSKIKEKWYPGTINGTPVRSRFKIPLDIKFTDGVDVKAKFPEGEEAFKKKILENLQTSKIQGSKKCEITFIVDYKGRISKISVNGENKSFNKKVKQSVSKIKELWIPAMLRNAPVTTFTTLSFSIN